MWVYQMRIVYERPPCFDAVNAKFRVAGQPVIFSWGDVIYNPRRVPIPPALMAHEEVHGRRQLAWGVEQWWEDYISSAAFRLDEEVRAHRVEYRTLISLCDNRQARRRYLKQTAKRLAAPLYGRMISVAKAQKILA